MKYICFRKPISDGVFRDIPIIFPECLVHSLMAEALLDSEELADAVIISAGFVDIDCERTYGKSESLNVESRKSDRLLIDTYQYLHGIVEI